jgi:hypothetical protein
MSIHERLPPEAKRGLEQVGWTKGLELAKLARKSDGQGLRLCNLIAQSQASAQRGIPAGCRKGAARERLGAS